MYFAKPNLFNWRKLGRENPVPHTLASKFYKPSVILQKTDLLDVMTCSLAKFYPTFPVNILPASSG